MSPERTGRRRFMGRPGAPGIAQGSVYVYDPDLPAATARQDDPRDAETELARLDAALAMAEAEILDAREHVLEELGEDHARIFDAHRLIMKDETLVGQARQYIREGWSAETAFGGACQNIVRAFQSLDGDKPDRTGDLRDVQRRVTGHLRGGRVSGLGDLASPVIVVARELSPSDTASMPRDKVLGFITERGGETSHSVILGRSLGIPVVVGAEGLLTRVQSGDAIMLDGHTGQIVINPDARTQAEFENLRAAYEALEAESLRFKDHPAETRDGRNIELLANIELPEEVEAVLSHGAAGVGLFRTEYLFLTRPDFPGEEDQYLAYRGILRSVAPDPVIIRTMDLGGEKVASYMEFPREDNPSLGWRGVRYALDLEEVFRTQIRAILRASVYGGLRLMVPMITRMEEIRRVKVIIEEVKGELVARGQSFRDDVPVGVMVETPSAVVIAHLLAREVDFFSIGTNDLIQYSLAVDRDNRKVQGLYDPFHPAILRQIKRTVKAAKQQRIPVGICGELPEDPLFTILLIGLGLDTISVNPFRVPEIKRLIRSITYDQAKSLVVSAWRYSTGSEIRRAVGRQAARKFPEIADLLAREEEPS
jgi:phosphotransferase system enzyme I (PtsI)